MSIEKLYIFEKPDAGKNFAKALQWRNPQRGKGFIQQGDICITWCYGHLLQQAPPEFYKPEIKQGWTLEKLPIIPDKWKMVYNESDKSRTAQLFTIRDLMKKSKTVVIATDDDREGETIGWEVVEFFNYQGNKLRMIYSELTVRALIKSNENLKDAEEYRNRYYAGLGRMRADWLMGFNGTIAYTAKNQNKLPAREVINAGRVISPLVYLLALKKRDIEEFIPIDHFSFKMLFSHNKGDYEGSFIIPKDIAKDGILQDKVRSEQINSELSEESEGFILDFSEKREKENQPLGFSLSELQKIASKKIGLSPKETLDTAQELYEKHHLISYPRTDSKYINEGQFQDRKLVMGAIYNNLGNNDDVFQKVKGNLDLNLKTSIWDDKKVGAHHAIVPTSEKKSITGLSQRERDLYEIICKRYVAQFLPVHEFKSSKIITQTKKYSHQFETKGRIVILNGWKDIEKDTTSDKIIPQVVNDENVKVESFEKINKKTQPPKHYTYGSLLDDMNNIEKHINNPKLKKIIKGKGIGTEATRADHIDGLFKKGFAKKEKNYIVATDKTISVESILPDENKQPEISAYWEEELDLIEKGKGNLEDFLKKQETIVKRIIKKVENEECTLKENVQGKGKSYACDKCDSLVDKFKSKKGNTLWRCLNRECGSLYADNRGKRGDIINITKQPEGDFPCPTCSKQMLRRKMKNDDVYFWVCSDNECKTFCRDNDGKLGDKMEKKKKQTSEHECPKCKEGRLIQRQGSNGSFWGCNNFPKCKTTLQDKENKPDYELFKNTSKSDHKCPNCEKGYLIKRKKRDSDDVFWGCNNFPNCKTIKNDNNGKPEE